MKKQTKIAMEAAAINIQVTPCLPSLPGRSRQARKGCGKSAGLSVAMLIMRSSLLGPQARFRGHTTRMKTIKQLTTDPPQMEPSEEREYNEPCRAQGASSSEPAASSVPGTCAHACAVPRSPRCSEKVSESI